jgi:uncharacterized protein YdcH (DUF465 family)
MMRAGEADAMERKSYCIRLVTVLTCIHDGGPLGLTGRHWQQMTLTHRAYQPLRTNRLGVVSQEGDTLSMEITQEELKAQLMQSNEEFRELVRKHDEYKKRVMELEAIPHPSEEEMQEEARLKKLKLHLKDQMAEIMNRHMATTVS